MNESKCILQENRTWNVCEFPVSLVPFMQLRGARVRGSGILQIAWALISWTFERILQIFAWISQRISSKSQTENSSELFLPPRNRSWAYNKISRSISWAVKDAMEVPYASTSDFRARVWFLGSMFLPAWSLGEGSALHSAWGRQGWRGKPRAHRTWRILYRKSYEPRLLAKMAREAHHLLMRHFLLEFW